MQLRSAAHFHDHLLRIRFALSTHAMLPLFLCLSLSLTCGIVSACPGRRIGEPLEYQDGDYIVAGVFWIGQYVETGVDNDTCSADYCSNYTTASFWSVQRALAFRRAMREERARLR